MAFWCGLDLISDDIVWNSHLVTLRAQVSEHNIWFLLVDQVVWNGFILLIWPDFKPLMGLGSLAALAYIATNVMMNNPCKTLVSILAEACHHFFSSLSEPQGGGMMEIKKKWDGGNSQGDNITRWRLFHWQQMMCFLSLNDSNSLHMFVRLTVYDLVGYCPLANQKNKNG